MGCLQVVNGVVCVRQIMAVFGTVMSAGCIGGLGCKYLCKPGSTQGKILGIESLEEPGFNTPPQLRQTKLR